MGDIGADVIMCCFNLELELDSLGEKAFTVWYGPRSYKDVCVGTMNQGLKTGDEGFNPVAVFIQGVQYNPSPLKVAERRY